MGKRDAQQAQQSEAALRSCVQDAAGTGSSADDLAKLAQLRDDGVITAQEFDQQKQKPLAGGPNGNHTHATEGKPR